MFGRIGFAKWSSMTLPVLIMNPFHVPPRPVREQWMTSFHNLQLVGKLDKLPYLVYWYGTLQMEEAYSFLQPKFVTLYENALKRKTHELPPVVVKKQNDPTKALTESDLNMIRGYDEMKEDLPLEPLDRKRGVVHFQEDYELELSDEESDDEGQDVEEEEETVVEETIKPKKKKSKLIKAEKDAGKSKKSSKQKAKDKKVSVASKVKEVGDDEFDVDQDEDEDSVRSTNVKKEKKLDAVKEYEQAIAAEKLPDSDDEMDDNYDPPSDVEELDPEHVDPKESKKPKVKKEREERKPKVEKKKKEQKTKVISEEELKKRELKAFRQCEERFCPLLERWNKLLVVSQDPDGLQRVLNKILPVVNEFSAIFIEAYDISNLLKETKNVLKAMNAKLDRCAEVKEAFRESYSSKRPQLPSNLKIRKNVELGRNASSSSSLKTGKRPQTDEPRVVIPKENAGSIGKPIPQIVLSATSPRKETTTDARAASPKPPPKKKKFSLTDLMRPAKAELDGEDTKDRNSYGGSKKQVVLPVWMTEEVSETSVLEDPRALALEFLLDMSGFFPSAKVNKVSVARAVEASIYKDCSKQSTDWVPDYWKRVHLLIVGICGKLQPTRLYTLMMSGRFETADQLVGLPEKTFIEAFEGDLVDV